MHPQPLQVWLYDPDSAKITLKTIFGVNPAPSLDTNFDGPDNMTVSPYGGIILAEDGDGINHLVGVPAGGTPYAFARNDLNDSEFTVYWPDLQRRRQDPVR
jgi:hypothetical protein